MVLHSAVLYLGFLLFVHVAATLLVLLWRRRSAALPALAPA
jgi:hypothetical protein